MEILRYLWDEFDDFLTKHVWAQFVLFVAFWIIVFLLAGTDQTVCDYR